jgi:hypothetical protein
MRFWLSRSLSYELSFFHDGILAITKPFHLFFFHMVESRLSRSLFTNFSFTWWNLGYHKAFSRIFLSHDGISAITKPFHEFFSHDGISAITKPFHKIFFHMMESRLSRSLFTNFSFTWWNLAITKPFHEFFIHMMESRLSQFGEDSFHIYHKEYLHRIRLVKNLASRFRALFARKRVRSFLF